jgi:RimJ/RimL family protein N-acetyltransferase
MTPTLVTPRLLLRAPAPSDFEPYAAFFASDRAVYEDGPLTRIMAWAEFATGAGCWVLRGFGSFSLEDRVTGRYLGEAGVYQPSHYPEPEIGWILMAEAEGKGLAYEAALAVRAWAYGTRGLPTLVSYIDARNSRSIRLAERLGAVRDPGAPSCDPGALVWRHPAPDALGSAA